MFRPQVLYLLPFIDHCNIKHALTFQAFKTQSFQHSVDLSASETIEASHQPPKNHTRCAYRSSNDTQSAGAYTTNTPSTHALHEHNEDTVSKRRQFS